MAYLIRSADGTILTVIAAKKDQIDAHLNLWASHQIEPEMTTTEAAALVSFGNTFYTCDEPYFLVHLGRTHATCVLIKDKKLVAAQACVVGKEVDLKLDLARTLFALEKKAKGIESLTILLTGSLKRENLFATSGKTVVLPEDRDGFNLTPELLRKNCPNLKAEI